MSNKIQEKLEIAINEIMNDPDIPQDLKDKFSKIREESKKEQEKYEKYLEENKHRKIIGYNTENFEPIYE